MFIRGGVAAVLFASFVLDASSAGNAFNVRDHGARGERTTNDRVAIQAAIEACAAAGGGKVVFPAGDYLCGGLRLASGVNIYLEAGATIWVSTDPRDYSAGGSGSVYASGSWGHLFFADGARNVSITGRGVINGQTTADHGGRWGVTTKLGFRTGILRFLDCRDVAVRGVSILNSDAWTLHFRRCENVAVEDVTIRNNYRRQVTDGIDPDMCRNVRIARCRISSGDDCIVLKTMEAHPCENVTVSDCVLESAASALKLGTESRGDFRNIRVTNCVITNTHTGIGLYLKDGGTMENITFSNIRIACCRPMARAVTPVFADIERRAADSKLGRIRNVTFENLDITSGSGVLVQGAPGRPVEDMVFRNIRFRVEQADDYAKRNKPVGGRRAAGDQCDASFARLPSYFTVAHARGFTLEDLWVSIGAAAFEQQPRSAFCGRHIDGLKVRNVRRDPAAESVGAVDLQDCRAAGETR
ncbi:MAG: right-handed parallel beta-helix repeat-containing protein [Verrucomicrobia bacterium]|nr:right-handed parallel beta-helix repeat-containing protein [Verrucomicrobiota bacterium]